QSPQRNPIRRTPARDQARPASSGRGGGAPPRGPATQRPSSRFPLFFMVTALAVAALAFGFYVQGGGGLNPFDSGNQLSARTIVGADKAPPNAETIHTLEELHERFGYPPDANLGVMRIPAI